ncbi:MAG: response regulator [Flammeovirgaceae bacterium]
MSKIYTILIADDHPIMAQGLAGILNQQIHYKVVAIARNGLQALELYEQWKADIALLDVEMPQMDGISLSAKLLEIKSEVKIVLFTNQLSQHHLAQIRLLPLKGVVMKQSAATELLACLAAITKGRTYYSDALYDECVPTAAQTKDLSVLTPTELEVLRLIAQGFTTREIAENTNRSHRTIENHRTNIREKLDIHGSNGMLHFLMKYRGQLR